MKSHIFGYGSLVDERMLPAYLDEPAMEAGYVCEGFLRGYRRAWNVAMDNSATIPGYKYYRDRHSHERPRCFVTFLNIYESDTTSVNGIAFEVHDTMLAELDKRERNYRRIEVTDRFEPRLEGRVWTYIATDEGLARYEMGARDGTAVIDEEYITKIESAFCSRGEKFYEQYVESTDPPRVPRKCLERIDLV